MSIRKNKKAYKVYLFRKSCKSLYTFVGKNNTKVTGKRYNYYLFEKSVAEEIKRASAPPIPQGLLVPNGIK